ncbi:ATP-binding protein [Streptomyces anthocyanicus]|uniref:ATP-binding protein n=1 Tax=Streptomyces TaxID=1883 RepID=UPI0029AE6927|nr:MULTISPECIES: ATP-binding protein [unclassified Streptomyces]MDX3351380.1 ATP-binding protein [Streptomyces sp. ME02-6979A]MDX3371369.1 ATP-binding protein [Streptomyces sp. ME02-6987-2C]MDX3398482.1 ATP-binding protein [Streptomyces sp. ME01-18h]MDX3426978.1 ATP-binding protein [Streptomyces sp. ME02-6985-2c]
MTFDVVPAHPAPRKKRLHAQIMTGFVRCRDREGELMNVHSSDAALQRPDEVLDVAVNNLVGPPPSPPVESVPISDRRRAFEIVAMYPAEVAAVSRGRRELRELLVLTGLEAIADAVALGAHELMANAVTHGCRHQAVKAFTVKVTHSSGRLRTEVQDPSGIRPFQSSPSDEREGGRGMLLVDALAANWGVQPGPGGGKTVWMELDVPGEGTTS